MPGPQHVIPVVSNPTSVCSNASRLIIVNELFRCQLARKQQLQLRNSPTELGSEWCI